MDNSSESKRDSLYPKRSFEAAANAEYLLDNIPELSTEDAIKLTNWENNIAGEFETTDSDGNTLVIPSLGEIYKTKINTTQTCPNYFVTEEGIDILRKIFEDNTLSFASTDEVRDFLANQDLSKLDTDQHQAISKPSMAWMEETYMNAILAGQIDEESDNDLIASLQHITIVRKPAKLEEKIRNLRARKQFIESQRKELQNQSDISFEENDYLLAQLYLLDMHAKRINEMIANAEQIQAFSHSKDNYKFSTSLKQQRNLARYDRFVYGSSDTTTDKTNIFTPITDEIIALKEEIEEGVKTEQIDKEQLTIKVPDIKVNAVDVKAIAEEVLRELGFLSEEVKFDPERKGPAKDNKAQVYIDPSKTSNSASRPQLVMNIPGRYNDKNYMPKLQSVIKVITHELEHIIQYGNANNLGIKDQDENLHQLVITSVTGTNRAMTNAEAGAVLREREARERIQEDPKATNLSYLAAINAIEEGENFLGAARAFYETYKRQNPTKSDRAAAKMAVNRTIRLFKRNTPYPNPYTLPTNSKELVYMEQKLYAEILKEIEKDYLLDVSGVNPREFLILERLGMIDIDNFIQPPEGYENLAELVIRKALVYVSERYSEQLGDV